MPSTPPVGPDDLVATLHRLAELAATPSARAYVAGFDAALAEVLLILEELRLQPTSPVWAPLYVAGWQAAVGSVRDRLVALQAEQDAEGEGRAPHA